MNEWLAMITRTPEEGSLFPKAQEIISEGMDQDALQLFIETLQALRGAMAHLENLINCAHRGGCECKADAYRFGTELTKRMS